MLQWDPDDGRYPSCWDALSQYLIIVRLPVALYQHHSPSAFLSGLDLSQRTQMLLTHDVGACRHLTNPRGELQDFMQDWILTVLNQVLMHFPYVFWISVQNRIETHVYFLQQGSSRVWSSNSTTANVHRSAENHGGKMLLRFTDWWKISVRRRCPLVVSSGRYIGLNRSASSHTSVASGGTMTDCIRLHNKYFTFT